MYVSIYTYIYVYVYIYIYTHIRAGLSPEEKMAKATGRETSPHVLQCLKRPLAGAAGSSLPQSTGRGGGAPVCSRGHSSGWIVDGEAPMRASPGLRQWAPVPFPSIRFIVKLKPKEQSCVFRLSSGQINLGTGRGEKGVGWGEGRENSRSPWGRTESDTTARLHFHFSLSCIGEGNGNPLQCSCLENPRDRGAWWAAVSGVAQSRTGLKRLSSSSSRKIVLMEGTVWAKTLWGCF